MYFICFTVNRYSQKKERTKNIAPFSWEKKKIRKFWLKRNSWQVCYCSIILWDSGSFILQVQHHPTAEKKAYLIKEVLCLPQDVFEFRQFQEVSLEGFLVGVHLFQLILKLLKAGLLEEGKFKVLWRILQKKSD